MDQTPTLQFATNLWPTDLRFIEFGVADGALGDFLLACGYQYLAVVERESRRAQLVARHPRLLRHLAVCRAGNRVRQNNADVLILSGPAASHLSRYRDIRHARYVACPVRPGPMLLWAVMFGFVQYLLGRLAWPKIVTLATAAAHPRLIAFRVRRPRPYAATRQFIPHTLGIEGFFRRLRAAGLRHVVLRWFESLPRLPAGEDLDLLVDDEGLAAVRDLLNTGPGLQPVDVYSVQGAPGADFRGMPYYPTHLAEQLLDRSVGHRALCAVPSPRDHFLSLAYHALYHKGAASGLTSSQRARPQSLRPEHDYASILQRLARQLKIDVPITLEDLDAYLDSQGWRPPHDMLVRLSRRNAWLRSRLKHAREDRALSTSAKSRAA